MRLIDADAFREKVCGWFHKDIQESNEVDDLAASLIMEIDNAPTVEAAPVVHGRWKTMRGNFVTGGGNPMWGCSKCGTFVGASLLPPKDNYCPSCGAKMDL